MKEILGRGADPNDSFWFLVTISDENGRPISGTYSDVQFDRNGQAAFKLKGSEEKVISGLPIGTRYLVEEIDANRWDYVTTSYDEEGEIPEEGAFAVFENERDTVYYSPTPTPEDYNTPTPTPDDHKTPTPTPTIPGGPTPTPGVTEYDISMQVRKVWDDNNNASGTRPSSVAVRLYGNGVDTGIRAVLDASNGWSYVFPNLPRYDEGGRMISYTVAEEQVSGYTMSVSGDMYKGYTITNSKGGRVPNTSDNFNAFGWASSTILSLLLAVYSALMLGRNTA